MTNTRPHHNLWDLIRWGESLISSSSSFTAADSTFAGQEGPFCLLLTPQGASYLNCGVSLSREVGDNWLGRDEKHYRITFPLTQNSNSVRNGDFVGSSSINSHTFYSGGNVWTLRPIQRFFLVTVALS